MFDRITVDAERVELAYHSILEMALEKKLSRAELVAGMLAMLGVQYKGDIMPPEDLAAFTNHMSEYLNMYFMPTGEVQ